jgi:hypothetical protein
VSGGRIILPVETNSQNNGFVVIYILDQLGSDVFVVSNPFGEKAMMMRPSHLR